MLVVDAKGIGEDMFRLLNDSNIPVRAISLGDKLKNQVVFDLQKAFNNKELIINEQSHELKFSLVAISQSQSLEDLER